MRNRFTASDSLQRRTLAIAATTIALLALAACGSQSDSDSDSPSDSQSDSEETSANGGSNVTILSDPVRLEGFQRYATEHPEVDVEIETYDNSSSSLQTKIQLANRVGDGWPDVTFSPPFAVAWAASDEFDFPAVLNEGLVSQEVLDGFPEGSLDQCMIDGKLYCLKNDLAQVVLWYNATLMDEFGYEVPTTWAEYEELGLRVAEEHPDYIVGAVGAPDASENFFWSSGCPTHQVITADTVRIDLEDPNCTRMASLLDNLIDAGSVSRDSAQSPSFTETYGAQNKVLMMPAASWFGFGIFQALYETPEGQIAAAPPLAWDDEDRNWTGQQGGGVFMVSRHAEDPEAAADVAVWMATASEYLSNQPAYPAYAPAVADWANEQADDFYAEDPLPSLQEAAELIRADFGNVRFDIRDVYATSVAGPVGNGESLSSVMPQWEQALIDAAERSGYTVEK